MNMHESVSLMDVVVGAAALFAAVFFAAWLASKRLRAWIERPKYRFQRNVQAYEEMHDGKDRP